jgi:DNA-directed RNA polymerase subunit F
MDEQGHEKKVTETYLLDAVSFGEAEKRTFEELQKMVSGEFSVRKIQMSNITEIIPSDKGDRWFKGKVTFITVDEESGKEKRVSQNVLAYGESVDHADKVIKEAMNGMMTDFEISAIAESKILDVFPYEKN